MRLARPGIACGISGSEHGEQCDRQAGVDGDHGPEIAGRVLPHHLARPDTGFCPDPAGDDRVADVDGKQDSDHARFARLAGLVDVLAISLDGPPEVHNRVRGHPRAFERLERGLDAVRAAGLAFGFIHTLTRTDWTHLPWVADYAAAQGASLLQVHPLEMSGRACSELADACADEDILARVYLMGIAIASKHGCRMQLQMDVVYRQHVREHPGLFYACADAGGTSAPEALGLLVLEADGSIVPLSHGFDRRYRIGNLHQQSLREAWPGFRARRLTALRRLCREVWTDLAADDGPLLSNWHEVVSARSHDRRIAAALTA